MSEGIDLWGWFLIIAVTALFGWFFWDTAKRMLQAGRFITDYLDSRSERARQQIEHERIHGRPPLWYRAMQKLILALLVAGLLALAWTKFRGL